MFRLLLLFLIFCSFCLVGLDKVEIKTSKREVVRLFFNSGRGEERNEREIKTERGREKKKERKGGMARAREKE